MNIKTDMSLNEDSASGEIDAIIKKLSDWRGEKLSKLRSLIKQANPDVVEEVKWKKATNPDGIPVWSDHGMICTGEFYKNHLRLTFAKGAELANSSNLFNTYRAIIIHENDKIDEKGFKDLIRTAVTINRESKKG